MVKSLEDMQKFGKDNVEATLKSFDAYAKNVQSIAQEVADYSKKSVDDGTKTVEKLFGAKSFDNAIEIQNAYLKSAYEGFVSQATKLGSLYADLARETYKPFESQVIKVTGAK
ncbi:MAG: phasin family protein [Rhizobiales bacterium]|nr:phasin family protein [Hyphomicrobiales bacterium]